MIVNGILQDTDHPLMFLREGEEQRLKPGGADHRRQLRSDRWAFPSPGRPRSRSRPSRSGPLTYYAVDHTPTYCWRSASWEISRVVISFSTHVHGGPDAWDADETLRRAIEIREGVICNEKILSFQNRAPHYPHALNVQ